MTESKTPPSQLPRGLTRSSENSSFRLSKQISGDHVPIEMLHIPSGPFLMGSFIGDANERPFHMHELDRGFFISKYPITFREYDLFCRATSKRVKKPKRFKKVATHPAIGVTWSEAKEFCDWVGGRLPTEVQWEKAARGITGSTYPWGNAEPTRDHCNWNANPVSEGKSTLPVTEFPKGQSPYGVMDLCGNVWQWCSDSYVPDAYELYERNVTSMVPVGSAMVCRGGSWVHGLDKARCSCRLSLAGQYVADDIGFRVVINEVS